MMFPTRSQTVDICEQVYRQANKLGASITAVCSFCNCKSSTINNAYQIEGRRFQPDTYSNLVRGLKRIQNGEYDGCYNHIPKCENTTPSERKQSEIENIEQRRGLMEVFKQDRIKAAQQAELAKYGKTTIGDKHITDGIA